MWRHDSTAGVARMADGAAVALAVGLALAASSGLVACGGGAASSGVPATSSMAARATASPPLVTVAAKATTTIVLTAPAEDASVDRSFTVTGRGSAFEGTLLWTLTSASSTHPISGYATVGFTSPKPFRFTVDAPEAGSYTLTVYRESASTGARSDAVSRTITVG